MKSFSNTILDLISVRYASIIVMFLQNVSHLVDAAISNLCSFFSGYKATDVTEKFEFIERSTEGKL